MTATTDAPPYAAGVHDIPEADYFGASWALSCSGAKLLLNCPARFFWRQDHQVYSQKFDIGHAAHKLILGKGGEIITIDAENYKTKAAQQARDAARLAGNIPLLPDELAQVQEMAAAVRAHPLASALIEPGFGEAEQSLFWQDDRTGIWCRARLDWMDERPLNVDYKTCTSARPWNIAKAVADFGYDQQDAWYGDGYHAITGSRVPFLFIFQEKEPPYVVTVCELDAETRRIGRAKNNQAVDVYRDCVADGEWPAYSDHIELISLPAWALPRED